jgi:hypothetical protein
LGIGDWGLGIGPNPQSPIPNPQSPIPNPHLLLISLNNQINQNKLNLINNFFIEFILINQLKILMTFI